MNVKKKKCKVCEALFSPFKSTEQVCGMKCAIIYAKQKEAKKKRREHYINNEASHNKTKLQEQVNAIARQIDFGLPCLATGKVPGQMHGGHVFSRGGHTQMRFNLHNIHRQSAQSNHNHSDDGLMQENLVKEYGSSYLEFLRHLRGLDVQKHTSQEYYGFYLKARKILRGLQKEIQKPLSPALRIYYRNKANSELNIYPYRVGYFPVTIRPEKNP